MANAIPASDLFDLITYLTTMSTPQNLHVIFTTDDPDYTELLDEALERSKFTGTFEFVRNGIRLLDTLYSSVVLPRLILLDVTHEDTEGFEVLKQIKEDPLLKSIAVILTSTIIIEREQNRCRELGGEDLIKQPHTLNGYDALVDYLKSYLT